MKKASFNLFTFPVAFIFIVATTSFQGSHYSSKWIKSGVLPAVASALFPISSIPEVANRGKLALGIQIIPIPKGNASRTWSLTIGAVSSQRFKHQKRWYVY